jgi:plasmid stability protein
MISYGYRFDGVIAMAAVTIRNLPDETLRALKKRAGQSGRSTEAEIRVILQNAVRRQRGMGTVLAEIGQKYGGIEFPKARRRSPVRPVNFES